jgi:hypothetical protein
MKGILIPSLLIFIAHLSCTPPDSVRLQDYMGRPADGLFAHVPVCLNEGNFHLGETLQDTLSKAYYFESDESEINCEGVKRKTWLILPSDTLFTCTFKQGRLIGFESETILPTVFANISDACAELQNSYSCLGELGSYLDENNTNTYKRHEDVFSESYIFKRNEQGITALQYSIYYNSEREEFNSNF